MSQHIWGLTRVRSVVEARSSINIIITFIGDMVYPNEENLPLIDFEFHLN